MDAKAILTSLFKRIVLYHALSADSLRNLLCLIDDIVTDSAITNALNFSFINSIKYSNLMIFGVI